MINDDIQEEKENLTGKYILIDGEPVEEPDLIKWAEWFERSGEERIVKQTILGGYLISTVFLGLDHNFSRTFPLPEGYKPLVFETMIFKLTDNKNDENREPIDYMVRTSTRKKAWEAHRAGIREVMSLL